MLKKKCQSIIEFMIIFGVLIFFFVVFMAIIQDNINEKNLEKETFLANNIALSVQNEIELASESPDGYYRDFYVPLNLIGKEYEIQLVDNFVYIRAHKIGLAYNILNYTGNIVKGNNIIQKQNGTVYIN